MNSFVTSTFRTVVENLVRIRLYVATVRLFILTTPQLVHKIIEKLKLTAKRNDIAVRNIELYCVGRLNSWRPRPESRASHN